MTSTKPRAEPGEAIPHTVLDALLPREMAERAEQIGVDKTRLDATSLVVLAVLAGAFIGMGALFSTIVTAGAEGVLPYGMTRLLAGTSFALGLILVIVGGAELFTGNNLMVMAWASRRVRLREMLRAWGLVYVGNLLGSIALAALVFAAGTHGHGGGSVGLAALTGAHAKVSFSIPQALVHGVLANVLVCLAVWLCFGARTTTDKILAIVPPIAAFVAAGFEHSIANMYLLSFALLMKLGASGEYWQMIGKAPAMFPNLTVGAAISNLVWVTIGNMIGGVLVGVTYWFVYLRTRRTLA